MKKICLLLLLVAFAASTTPVYALKLIMNNEFDRTVPSRCSRPSVEELTEVEEEYDNIETTTNTTTTTTDSYGSQYGSYWQNPNQKYFLSMDIRPELIGTDWKDFTTPIEERNVNNFTQTSTKTETTPTVFIRDFGNNYSREAADYYVLDTIKHPNKAYKSGFNRNSNSQ